MARTKQTARKSTGGAAPRKRLSSKRYESATPMSTSAQVETWQSEDDFEKSSDTESEDLEGSEDGSEEQAPTLDSKEVHELVLLTPLHLRKDPTVRSQGRCLVLPMRFGSLNLMGKKSLRKEVIDATPDTGSRVNAITRDCLRAIGGKMKLLSAADDSVLLGDGYVLRAKGSATLRCSFAQGAPGTLMRKFLVFDCLLPGIDVLLGRPFLAFTKTLTEYSNRLKEIANLDTLPRLMNMSVAGQGLRCYLDSVLTIALVDTGSDANLMKTDYAKQRKWDIKPVPVSKRYVLLPGNRIAQLSGFVRVRLDPFPKMSTASSSRTTSVISSNSCTLSDRDVASVTAHDPSSRGQSTGLVVTFYLFDKLIVDVLLGQLLLDTLDAFNAHTEGLMEFDVPEAKSSNLLGIKWASRLAEKYRNLCHSDASQPRELPQVNAANEPRPDTSAITQFLGVSDISNLVDPAHFELCMKERWFREAHRRQVQADGIESSLAKLRAGGTLGPADADQFRLTMQRDEDVARQAYEQGKTTCREAWDRLLRWL